MTTASPVDSQVTADPALLRVRTTKRTCYNGQDCEYEPTETHKGLELRCKTCNHKPRLTGN